MYLAGGGRPDFRTLARFRRDNAAAFTAIFRETVVLALRLGLARLAKIRALRERLEAEQRAEQGLPEDAAPAIGDAAAPVPLPTALSAAAAHRGPDHAPPVTQPPRPRGPVPARRGGSAGRIGCET